MEKQLTSDSRTVSLPPESPESESEKVPVNGTSAGIRYASDEQFQKAQLKTSAQHAGLFRRLAK